VCVRVRVSLCQCLFVLRKNILRKKQATHSEQESAKYSFAPPLKHWISGILRTQDLTKCGRRPRYVNLSLYTCIIWALAEIFVCLIVLEDCIVAISVLWRLKRFDRRGWIWFKLPVEQKRVTLEPVHKLNMREETIISENRHDHGG